MTDAADEPLPVRRVLISVADKTGLGDFARALVDGGATIVSTGSTADAVAGAGLPVMEVADLTGFPEILDGRVKTLHPRVHAAILADRANPAHERTLAEHDIEPFDLVVVNLYGFEGVVAEPAVDEAQAIEHIDVGGPAMVRAAAKNHGSVAVVVDPADYDRVLAELAERGGVTSGTRRELARKAFARTAAYDAAIVGWLQRDEAHPEMRVHVTRRAQELRYGENPHQAAAFYVEEGARWGLGVARQLHGKELSYTNLLDTDAAWRLVSDLEQPAVAIIKHTNPAGCAVADTLAEAYPNALAGDPLSAFGGIVACNRTVDAATAKQIAEVFTEVVVAPAFERAALDVLTERKNLRLLETAGSEPPTRPQTVRSVAGGLLVQDTDSQPEDWSQWYTPTATNPNSATMADLRFAWTVCKHTKSNAVVLAKDGAVVGVGAGQMSRVDSVRLAVDKAQGRAHGAVLASDAFFPFRDGPDLALEAGVRALIHPGGSVRDAEVVAACDERGVPLVATGRRHFIH